LTDAEVKAVIKVTMDAFAKDPFVSAGTGGQLSNLPLYEKFTACFVNGAAVDGEIWVAEKQGEVVGTSIWFPPGTEFMGSEKQREAVNLDGYLGMLKPEVADWFMGFFIPNIDELCAESLGGSTARAEAHHLQILGVSPTSRRQGIGKALFFAGANEAFAQNKRVVWETSTAPNLALYQSWGAESKGHAEFESKFEGTKFPLWVLELPQKGTTT